MSDYILKFWPIQQVNENKTDFLKAELKKQSIFAEETEFWNEPAFKPGELINEFLEPKLEKSNPHFQTIYLTIYEQDYGVKMGKEDFEYLNRNNVISIKGGEGGFNKWDRMCMKLEEITSDKYEGGWELL